MTPGHADRYLVCPQHGSIRRVVGVFGRRPENMRENMLENVRGRNFSVGHLDFYEPLLLRAPPNSPHSWITPLTPREHHAPTAHLRQKPRFYRPWAGPRNAATPPDGGRSKLPVPAQGHPRPASAVWPHARLAWLTELDLRAPDRVFRGRAPAQYPTLPLFPEFSPKCYRP